MSPPSFDEWIESHCFTPSELEDYLLCPFRFYASTYLKVKPPQISGPELTPLEIGSILHAILEGTFKKCLKKREDLLPLLAHELKKVTAERTDLIPVLIEHQRIRMERALFHFFEKEIEEKKERPHSSLKPSYFEWRFESLSIPDGTNNPIKIKGRIDRIDIDPNRKRFLVIDYKTGSQKITGNQIRKGQSLQLPLYIMAVKQLLLPDHEPIGGLYYHLSDLTCDKGIIHADQLPENLEIHPRSSSLVPSAEWEALFKTANGNVVSIVQEIRREHFASKPEPCEPWCPYRDICLLRSHRGLR